MSDYGSKFARLKAVTTKQLELGKMYYDCNFPLDQRTVLRYVKYEAGVYYFRYVAGANSYDTNQDGLIEFIDAAHEDSEEFMYQIPAAAEIELLNKLKK